MKPPVSETSQPDPKLTDADVVSGGPLDPNSPENKARQAHAAAAGGEGGDPADEGEPAPAAVVTPPVAANPIIVDGISFKDTAALAAYTSELNKRIKPYDDQAKKPAVELIDGRPIDEVMFDNPQRYHQYVLDQATTRATSAIHAVNHQASQERAFWDNFYTANPDLKAHDKFVQFNLRSSFDEYAKLPVQEAQAKLAKETRSSIDGIRQEAGIKTTELASGGVTTLGSTGTSVKRTTQPEKPKSFLQQVKAAQRRA